MLSRMKEPYEKGESELHLDPKSCDWCREASVEAVCRQPFNIRFMYADDFEWTRGALERLDLTLNEKKTSIRNASREHFDFLGYTFGPHHSMRTEREYIGFSPSKKSVTRIKKKVGDLLEPSNVGPWEQVRNQLNQKLRGWRSYFSCGATAKAYRAVDEYVYDRVLHFLRRRHKVPSRGTHQFSSERVYGPLGVVRLQGPRGVRS